MKLMPILLRARPYFRPVRGAFFGIVAAYLIRDQTTRGPTTTL
jgi:hypothetical protein